MVANHRSVAEADDNPVVELDIHAAFTAAHVVSLMDDDLVRPGVYDLEVVTERLTLERIRNRDVEIPGSLASAHVPLGHKLLVMTS